MAIKIKKTVPRNESETDAPLEGEVVDESEASDRPFVPPVPKALADDKVFLATRDTFDWVNDHRNTLLGLVAAVVVGMLVFSTVRARAEHSRAADALSLFRAVDGVTTPAAGSSARDGNERLRAAAEALAADHAGEPIAAAAQMLEGRARVALADGSGALTAYQAAASATPAQEGIVARLGVATAHAQAGNLTEGVAVLDALLESEPGARGAVLVQKAVLLDTFGTPEQALEAWRAAAEVQAPTAANPFATGSAANRVRALEIQLGTAAVATGEGDQ